MTLSGSPSFGFDFDLESSAFEPNRSVLFTPVIELTVQAILSKSNFAAQLVASVDSNFMDIPCRLSHLCDAKLSVFDPYHSVTV